MKILSNRLMTALFSLQEPLYAYAGAGFDGVSQANSGCRGGCWGRCADSCSGSCTGSCEGSCSESCGSGCGDAAWKTPPPAPRFINW